MFNESVPATQECDCPARKALDRLLESMYAVILPLPDTIREAMQDARALSDPCPCEQLRAESAERLRRWLVAVSRAESRLSPEAEAELRAELATARSAAKAYAEFEESRIINLCEVIGAEDLELAADKASRLLAERDSLRVELAEEKRLRENDQQYALQMHHTICEYENAGGSGKYTVACAERDDARRLLEEAREALARIAGEIPYAAAHRSDRYNIALATILKIDAARKEIKP